ncbi:MAG: hypothetical protein Q9168_003817, partial [Polycauliona sp. 1 TL-2023]
MYFLLLMSLLQMLLNHVTAIPPNDLSLPTSAKAKKLATSTSDLIKVWAERARRDRWSQNETSQRAIAILEAMFEGKDTPHSSASRLADIYNPALKAGFSHSPVFQLWAKICEAMLILGGDMEIDKQLVQLLNAIARLPDVLDENGRPIGPGGGYSGVYWKNLPAMGIMFREYAIESTDIGGTEREPADYTGAERKMLLDVTTFGALFFHYGEVDLGMSFHADVSLEEGIEQEPPQTPEQLRYARTDVPPAATWILIAGQDIYDLCKSREVVRGRQYDLGRWAFWKTRFRAIAVNEGLTDDVKGYARRAVSRMTEIERPRYAFFSAPHLGSDQTETLNIARLALKATTKANVRLPASRTIEEASILFDVSVRFDGVHLRAPVLSTYGVSPTKISEGMMKSRKVIIVDRATCTTQTPEEHFLAILLDHFGITELDKFGEHVTRPIREFLPIAITNAESKVPARLEA